MKRWSKSHPEQAESWKAKEARYHTQVVPGSTEEVEADDSGTKRIAPSPKKSSTKPQSVEDTTQTPKKALNYLTTHQQSPSTWKFNKSRQSALLRSLFSLTSIPPSYDPALLSYLSGLHKGAAATSRVRNVALECRREDEEWVKRVEGEEAVAKREEYFDAVKRIQNSLRGGKEGLGGEVDGRDQGWDIRLMKRQRAEFVLFAVGEGDESLPPSHPSSSSRSVSHHKTLASSIAHMNGTAATTSASIKSSQPLPGIKPKAKRKRKARTIIAASDSSSSSSSDSSSSSSSSSSREDEGGKGTKKSDNATKSATWDTTSDSSSSSSSENESEHEPIKSSPNRGAIAEMTSNEVEYSSSCASSS